MITTENILCSGFHSPCDNVIYQIYFRLYFFDLCMLTDIHFILFFSDSENSFLLIDDQFVM